MEHHVAVMSAVVAVLVIFWCAVIARVTWRIVSGNGPPTRMQVAHSIDAAQLEKLMLYMSKRMD